MYDASAPAVHAIPAVSPVDLISQAKKNLGVTTIVEVAVACGLSKSTLERLAADPSSTIFKNAARFCLATGIPLDALYRTTQQSGVAA